MYEFLDSKFVKILGSLLPDSFQAMAEQLNSLPQMRENPGSILKLVCKHVKVLGGMISAKRLQRRNYAMCIAVCPRQLMVL